MTTITDVIRRARGLPELRRQLRASDYLWYNAAKKIDLRTVQGFADLAAPVIAEQRTLLREDRLYTLWQAISQLGTGDVVEVGVYRGGSSAFIAAALDTHGLPNRVVAVDTFEGHAVVDPDLDADHEVGVGFADVSVTDVRGYLAKHPRVKVIQGDIMEVAPQVEGPVALVHLDVDVYRPTLFTLNHFADRLAPGAMMIVDDYGFVTCPGSHQAVEEFVTGRSDFVRLHLLTGQAVLVKHAAG